MAFQPIVHFLRGIQNRLISSEETIGSVQNKEHLAYIRQLQREFQKTDALNIPLDRLNVVVIDIETTGFYPNQGDEMISIGAIKMIQGEMNEFQSFYSLTQCNQEISKEISDLTGITNEQIKNAPALSEVLYKFLQYSENLPLIAHHSAHEKSFFQHAYWKLYRRPFPLRIIDTSFLFQIAEPNLSLVALEDLCEHNSIPITNRHHALGDAILAAKLWRVYIEKVKEKQCFTLKDVYERLAKKS